MIVTRLCRHRLCSVSQPSYLTPVPLSRSFRSTSLRHIPDLRAPQNLKRHASTASKDSLTSVMETIKSTLAENLGGVAHAMAGSAQQFSIENDVPDLSNKVALITGGSEGIGYATAYTLLKHNAARVFIISMREEVQSQAEESVRKHLGDTFADRLTFFQCDLSDLPSVAQIAKQVSSQTDRLDILCLNAGRGIMTYQTTDYIIDRHMAVNHLGHVTLTSHLLPLLKKTASATNKVRIQIQSSNAHQGSPKDTKFATIDELQQDLGPNGQYGRSKLANLLYARYLAAHLTKEHPNILANATHPGVVETKMSTEDIHEPYPKLGYAMDVGLKPFKKDIWEGCVSTVFAATAIEESGKYVCPPATFEEGSELANDAELGEQLMRLTREIVKRKFASQSVDKGCPLKDY